MKRAGPLRTSIAESYANHANIERLHKTETFKFIPMNRTRGEMFFSISCVVFK